MKSIILYKTEGFTDNNYMTFIDHVRKVLTSMSNTDQNNIRMFREVLHVQKAMGYKWSNSLETWKERDFILYNSKLYYFKLPDKDEIHKYSQLRGIIDMTQGVQLFRDCFTEESCQESSFSYRLRINNQQGIYKIIFNTKNDIITELLDDDPQGNINQTSVYK